LYWILSATVNQCNSRRAVVTRSRGLRSRTVRAAGLAETVPVWNLEDQPVRRYISRLRTYEKYPRVFTRTKRYCSFIQCASNHYQNSISNSSSMDGLLVELRDICFDYCTFSIYFDFRPTYTILRRCIVFLLWPPYVIGGPLYFCFVISIFYLSFFLSFFFFLA